MAQPQSLGPQALRLLDANLNRLAEGLRYLEDVARFLLNDGGLTALFSLSAMPLLPATGSSRNSFLIRVTRPAMSAWG